jgi:hypothetical protein
LAAASIIDSVSIRRGSERGANPVVPRVVCATRPDFRAGLAGATDFAGVTFRAVLFAAGGLVATLLTAGRDETTFKPAFLGFETGCLAAIFLAGATLAGFRALAVTDLLVAGRIAPVFRVFSFALATFPFAAPVRVVLVLAIGAFDRDTLTSPRAARLGLRAVTATFPVGWRVGLLREVEAIGTTLGTVETW